MSRQLNRFFFFFFSSQSDLNDQALENSSEEWFMDGSSYVEVGITRAGYAIVNLQQIIKTSPLPTWHLCTEG